jgi:arylformamidase
VSKAKPEPDDWRAFELSALEREYSPSSMVADINDELAVYAEASRSAQQQHPPITLNYEVDGGSSVHQTIDLYLPYSHERQQAPEDQHTDRVYRDIPLLIYIHGGYWQALSKHESAFMVPGVLRYNCAVAVIDYTLAPTASVRHIVEQCRCAVNTLFAQAGSYHLDPNRFVVAGSSAGAHLAALSTMDLAVAGLVLLSGIYDLRPIVSTYINEPLLLNEEEACALNPLLQEHTRTTPCIVAVGQIETSEFHRQSRDYANYLRAYGVPVAERVVADRNHFDLPIALGRPSDLHDLTMTLLVSGRFY